MFGHAMFNGVGLGGASWLAERQTMRVLWVRRRRKIWLRISPGSERKGKGMFVVVVVGSGGENAR